MTEYVVGFAFDHLHKVWLIRKNRPDWQAGKLNGVGGKIEMFESSRQAMSREFYEEAGVMVSQDRWRMFHREAWASGNSVDFFVTRLNRDERPTTMTDEKIVPLSWLVLSYSEWAYLTLYNLPYLVPMAYVHLTENPADIPVHQPQANT